MLCESHTRHIVGRPGLSLSLPFCVQLGTDGPTIELITSTVMLIIIAAVFFLRRSSGRSSGR